MCDSVYFVHEGREIHHPFANPKAVLPVVGKQSIILLPWGRRKQQSGALPLGGWAHLDGIYSGRWDKFFPKPVKLPIRSFMVKDYEGLEHWYDVTKGQVLQGLVAKAGHERRVYMVTLTPERDDAIHERWPRIMVHG